MRQNWPCKPDFEALSDLAISFLPGVGLKGSRPERPQGSDGRGTVSPQRSDGTARSLDSVEHCSKPGSPPGCVSSGLSPSFGGKNRRLKRLFSCLDGVQQLIVEGLDRVAWLFVASRWANDGSVVSLPEDLGWSWRCLHGEDF